MNKIFLLGNTGKAPEILSFENGSKLAKVSLATTETSKNKAGEKISTVTWHDLVFWGNIVQVVEKYVTKGTKILIEGKLVKRQWEDKDGQKKYQVEVHVKEMTLLGSNTPQSNQPDQSAQLDQSTDSFKEDFKSPPDDDLPF